MDSTSACRPPPAQPALPPLDLSHHYSQVTRQRIPSKIKAFYKCTQPAHKPRAPGGVTVANRVLVFAIPGIRNFAGGRSLIIQSVQETPAQSPPRGPQG